MKRFAFQTLTLAFLTLLAVRPCVAAETIEILDGFNDGVFNADGQWAPLLVTSGIADTSNIVFDESTRPGLLTVDFSATGGQTAALLHLRENAVLDAPGKFAEVTITIPEGTHPGIRVGLHMLARRDQPTGSRADTFRFGMQANGILRLHAYRSFPGSGGGAGVQPDEYADPELDIGYLPGDEVTVRVTRIGTRDFVFLFGVNGPAVNQLATLTHPEGSELPIFPGLLIENGIADFVATFDDFAVGAPERFIVDDFDDGVWNADGHWDAENITQGGDPADSVAFNETAIAGALAVDYADSGQSGQTTLVLRDDVTVDVGGFVQVLVALAGGLGPMDSGQNVRVGLALASSRGRDAAGGADRSNVLYWGLRADELVRGHFYGANNVEIGDADTGPISDYSPGTFYALAIRRVTETRYELHWARAGGALVHAGTFTYTGSTGPGEMPPDIPGLLLDNGLACFVAVLDDFEVGEGWPPPVSAPRFDVPLIMPQCPADPAPDTVSLCLPRFILELPKFESNRELFRIPGGEDTGDLGALLEHWKGRFYLAWFGARNGVLTGKISVSADGETWSPPFWIGDAGDVAYEAYMRDRFDIPAGEPVLLNTAPRNWHATPERLYLWSLAWVEWANGSIFNYAGRIFWTEDGETWNEIAPLELERLENEAGLLLRTTGSNRGFIRLSDGRLMAAGMEALSSLERIGPATTFDLSGLSGWSGGVFNVGGCTDVGEPGGWEGPDGVLHYTVRCQTRRVWHAFSNDGGSSWSVLEEQPGFPDGPSNKKFGKLPDGSNFYVGSPMPGRRQYLVFSMSQDGWNFDESYLVRWEPGSTYEYPTALYHDGFLYVAYANGIPEGPGNFMEVARIDVSGIISEEEPTLMFIRGDANGDGGVNIADVSFIANFVFGIDPATPPPCRAAADSNGDGSVNIADPSYIANFLFGIEPAIPPPAPFPNCGLSGDTELFACAASPACTP